jgi:D-alanine-D-alanine ligase
MKICVLLGGASTERNVSIHSGLAVGKELAKAGHQIFYLDPATPLTEMESFLDSLSNVAVNEQNFQALNQLSDHYFLKQLNWLKKENFDIVFNGLHGGNGENGRIAAVLEMAKIPFTGSGYYASAIAMDKYRSKLLMSENDVGTARSQLIRSADEAIAIPVPLVIKPNSAGSSVGLHIVKEETDLKPLLTDALIYDRDVLAEAYITGRELTVPVISGKAYPVLEIKPKSGVYDYASKYGSNMSEYIVPAEIPENLKDHLQEQALRVVEAIGLQNYCRIDFRVNEAGESFCLEANTLPGMTATSLTPKSAKAAGLDFIQLLEHIISDALTIQR